MANVDTSNATYKPAKGARGISGIKSSIQDGQKKASTESGYPGMADSTPSESDKNQSAP